MDYLWIFLIIVGLFVYVYFKLKNQKELVCIRCYAVVSTKTKVKGSLLIEIVLWLCFLIPGLLYSLWRSSSRYKACTECGSQELVPVDSTRGSMVLKKAGLVVEKEKDNGEIDYSWLQGNKK